MQETMQKLQNSPTSEEELLLCAERMRDAYSRILEVCDKIEQVLERDEAMQSQVGSCLFRSVWGKSRKKSSNNIDR